MDTKLVNKIIIKELSFEQSWAGGMRCIITEWSRYLTVNILGHWLIYIQNSWLDWESVPLQFMIIYRWEQWKKICYNIWFLKFMISNLKTKIRKWEIFRLTNVQTKHFYFVQPFFFFFLSGFLIRLGFTHNAEVEKLTEDQKFDYLYTDM